MKIVVQNQGGVPVATLEDAEDFGRFEIRIIGVSAHDARTALAPVAELQADHAFVDPIGFFSLPGARPDTKEWRHHFDAMVDFASGKGWVDPAGRIRAHVVMD
jgi:hypothetical protein